MFHTPYILRTWPLSLMALLLFAGHGVADGLVAYRNDTNQPIIVQSAVVVNNSMRRSKPQMIYPGEIAVDGLNATDVRRITLYDPKKPSTAIHQEEVSIGKDVLLSIQVDTTIMVKGASQASRHKLVPTTLPNLPSRPSTPNQPPQSPGPPKKK